MKKLFGIILIFFSINIFAEKQQLPANGSQNTPTKTEAQNKKKPEITNDNVIVFLRSRNPEKKSKAITFIKTKKPEEILPQLFQLILTDETNFTDEKSFKRTIYNLCREYPIDKTSDHWKNILKESRESALKIEIIKFFASLNDRQYISDIANQLDNPDFRVREAACLELKKIRNDIAFVKVFRMSTSENPVMRLYAAQSLIYLYDRRFDPYIIQMMNDQNKSVRMILLKVIEKHNFEKLGFLIKQAAQNDPNYEIRKESLEIFIRNNDKSSLYIFPRLLKDSNSEVRYSAIKGISHFYYVSMSYTLSKLLIDEKSDKNKNIILNTLIKFKNAGYYEGISSIVHKDRNPYLRRKAVFAAALIKGHTAENILIYALNDENYLVRAEAAAGLRNYNSKKSRQALIKILEKDKVQFVRTAALNSLIKINDKNTINNLYDIALEEKNPFMKRLIKKGIDTIKN